MSGSVRLSPKYGLNPTIATCFWCGKDKNEIALMGHIGGRGRDLEAPKRIVLDFEPCDECKKNMASGFTVMEATTEPNTVSSIDIQKGVYPTGRYVVVKTEAANRIFGEQFTSKGKAFMSSSDFSRMFQI